MQGVASLQVLLSIVLVWCIISFPNKLVAVEALASSQSGQSPLSHYCRRKVLVDAISGVTALGTSTAAVPAIALASAPVVVAEHNALVSIESAAAQTGYNDSQLGRIPVKLIKLRLYPDPCLRRIASPVKQFGADLEKVVHDILVPSMKTDATSAVQYGIDARVIVLKGSASPNSDATGSSPIVFVNPNVLARSTEDKMVQWREYCLVVPRVDDDDDNDDNAASDATEVGKDTNNPTSTAILEIDLLRDEVVEVAAQDITGRPIRKALRGEAARAFQHELDHLDGILIIDHASLDELPASMAKLEAPFHAARQRRAFQRNTYEGNGPLYW